MNNKPHIVIVGGGFGGAYTAKNLRTLAESGDADVTLVSKENYFLFTPLLHEVATGALSQNSVVEPVREVLRGSPVRFLQAEVRTIDPEKKIVKTSAGPLPYDFLVISSGATTNYYNVPGAEKYSFTLKDLDDAMGIRSHIIKICEKASYVTDTIERRKLLSVAIIGGGATGVELATELVEFMKVTLCAYYHHACFDAGDMKITLIASSAELLPQFPPEIRTIALNELKKKEITVQLATSVTAVENHKVMFVNGGTLEAQTIIWVAGVTPHEWEIPGTERERGNRIKTDEFQRVVGRPNIFALGDASGTHPMLAQVAVQQSKVVARNIEATIHNKLKDLRPFIFKEKGILISLGQWSAAGKIFGKIIEGPIMWWLWRTIYLFNFHSWRKRFRIAVEWTIDLFYPRDISSV